jgi:predicted O-methyltransferase YrrM
MAYHGYLPLIKQYISNLTHAPSVLEIGVDTGISYLTLANFLSRTRENFLLLGVDILIKENVQIVRSNLDLTEKQQAHLIQNNSLEILPALVKNNIKFDVILLDGDHNYHTVINEMSSIKHLTHDHTLIVIDDYYGRWSEKDLWYIERQGYENVKSATHKVDTEKHGVKAAVDEWLVENSEWKTFRPIMGEPILLLKQNECFEKTDVV